MTKSTVIFNPKKIHIEEMFTNITFNQTIIEFPEENKVWHAVRNGVSASIFGIGQELEDHILRIVK